MMEYPTTLGFRAWAIFFALFYLRIKTVIPDVQMFRPPNWGNQPLRLDNLKIITRSEGGEDDKVKTTVSFYQRECELLARIVFEGLPLQSRFEWAIVELTYLAELDGQTMWTYTPAGSGWRFCSWVEQSAVPHLDTVAAH